MSTVKERVEISEKIDNSIKQIEKLRELKVAANQIASIINSTGDIRIGHNIGEIKPYLNLSELMTKEEEDHLKSMLFLIKVRIWEKLRKELLTGELE